MKWNECFLPTLRKMSENNKEFYNLLFKAGIIAQAAPGIYYFLPQGLKVLDNIELIVDEEMSNIGANKVLMSTMQDMSLWHQSGRNNAYGDEMLKAKDRAGKELLYSPTNEESAVDLMSKYIHSYKQLPIMIYHNQWKFRDEIRPKAGVIRSREFKMHDGYSACNDLPQAHEMYLKVFSAYVKIFQRLGVKCVYAKADPGVIGGYMSHEIIVLSENGDSKIAIKKDIDVTTQFSEKESIQKLEEDAAIFVSNSEKIPEGYDEYVGYEGAHIFIGLDTAEKLNFTVTSKEGKNFSPIMSCYGIGLTRLIGVIIDSSSEQLKKNYPHLPVTRGFDNNGIIWPESIAPFKYVIIDLFLDGKAEILYNKLLTIIPKNKVLWDNRDLSAGIKMNDADLIGIPYQIIIGNNLEFIYRDNKSCAQQFNNIEDIQNFVIEHNKKNNNS